MPHRRPSSPLDDEQAAVNNLGRNSSETSRPQRFLAKLKHANLTLSNNSSAPAPSLPLPTSSPQAGAASPPTPDKVTPQNSAQMHRLGTPLPQIQVQNAPPSSLMSNPTAASASSISLASTLVGGQGSVNPNMASTATISSASGLGGSSNPPLGGGIDRDPWHMLHFHVLPLFNGEALRIPIEDLNELVSKHISNIVARAPARAVTTLEHDVESLLARGMVTLNIRVAEVDDVKLIPRLVDTWHLFWYRVLPYVEGIFLPLKTEKPMQSLTKTPKSNRPPSPTMQSLPEETTPVSAYPVSHLHTHSIDVRALSLCSFRDSIVLPIYTRLLGLLNAGTGQAQGKEKAKDSDMMFQSIQQMLLVLLSVSHTPLASSQSQSSLLTKSPIPLSPDANGPPSALTPTSASKLNTNTSMGSNTGFGTSSGALGIITSPISATSSTTIPSSSNPSLDNALSLLLNALRNPISISGATTSETSNIQGNRNTQSRISQPFLISRNSSFLSGSGPRDRRGRIATRKPNLNNDGRATPLELDLKTMKSPVLSPSATATEITQYDHWDDETPRNAGFKHENPRSYSGADSSRTHETRARSHSDGTLDNEFYDDDSRDEEGYDHEGHESYSDHTRSSSSSHISSGTPIPEVRAGQGGRGTGLSNGTGWIKRSRRASTSEVDGHGNEVPGDLRPRAHMQNVVERMIGLR